MPEDDELSESIIIEYEIDGSFVTDDIITSIFCPEQIAEQLEFLGYLNKFKKHFRLSKKYVQTKYLMPIMSLYGSTIYISVHGNNKNQTYIVDNGDFGIIRLPYDLTDFLGESVEVVI